MGQVFSTMSNLIFGPASNATQLLAATSNFVATGQAQSHSTIHRPTQAPDVVIVEQPFQFFDMSISDAVQNRLQLETTRVAQQKIQVIRTKSCRDLSTVTGSTSAGSRGRSL